MKKRAVLIIALILGLWLTACGVAESKYESLLESAGVESMETVTEGVTFQEAYQYDLELKKEDGKWLSNTLIEMSGVEKKHYYVMTYTLGDNKELAEAKREEYINYLIDQGFVLKEDDSEVYGGFYVKGANVIVIADEIVGPVHWDDESEGQYGFYIWLY